MMFKVLCVFCTCVRWCVYLLYFIRLGVDFLFRIDVWKVIYVMILYAFGDISGICGVIKPFTPELLLLEGGIKISCYFNCI